jgi:glycosyltransferase involved in cell wall biosynthesis
MIKLVKKLNIEKNISFAGMVKNPAEILKQSDAFVFPSLIEGLSNSLIEAMASGLPCIATNIPGNIEVLGDSRDNFEVKQGTYLATKFGILFNPSDVEGLTEAIKYILSSSDARKITGENAFKKIKEEFDIHSIADNYLKLYEDLTEF